MKVLIVEDDERKRFQLERFVESLHMGCSIQIAKSYHSALQSIIANRFDFILLDMTMPTYDIGHDEDGGRPQAYAGREILRQLDRRKMSSPVIVVTQYDVFGEGADALTRSQLDRQLRDEHPLTYKGTVYYNAASDEWKAQLRRVILSLGRPGEAAC